MLLYAQINRKINQMINQPVKLPGRYTTPDGVTINQFNKLPTKVLTSLNWLPVIYEELVDGATHNSQPIFDEINQQFIFEAIPQDISILLKESECRIDEAASFACERYISRGIGQECRYMIKREQAINYLADIPVNIDKYPMIKREAELSGMTYDELALLIIKIANDWILIAAEIEALRCGGKKKCRNTMLVIEVIQFRDAAISALRLI